MNESELRDIHACMFEKFLFLKKVGQSIACMHQLNNIYIYNEEHVYISIYIYIYIYIQYILYT